MGREMVEGHFAVAYQFEMLGLLCNFDLQDCRFVTSSTLV